jgi:hypothetical protein
MQMQKFVERKNMSVAEAKKAASETFAQLFHDATRNYEEALKSGLELQEESSEPLERPAR